MTRPRVLTFPSQVDGEDVTPRDEPQPVTERPEPVSPFSYLMPEKELTPRERLHRRRMVDALRARHFVIRC